MLELLGDFASGAAQNAFLVFVRIKSTGGKFDAARVTDADENVKRGDDALELIGGFSDVLFDDEKSAGSRRRNLDVARSRVRGGGCCCSSADGACRVVVVLRLQTDDSSFVDNGDGQGFELSDDVHFFARDDLLLVVDLFLIIITRAAPRITVKDWGLQVRGLKGVDAVVFNDDGLE